MTALENQFPPLAQALGRLRQPRAWPYANRTTDAATAPETTPTDAPDDATPAAAPADNDFLRILPEPALTGDLPEAKPAAPTRAPLTAIEAIALAPLNRTYWFDL
ncbi:MAG: hypothetical protein H7067_14400 [Burkholderiales bacterium]|nr:hypothetical protein [Opitutaceae bacterium]